MDFQYVYLDDVAVFYNFTQQLSVLTFILLLFQFCCMLQENYYFFRLYKRSTWNTQCKMEMAPYLNPAAYKHYCTGNISTQILTLILTFILSKIGTLSQFMGDT